MVPRGRKISARRAEGGTHIMVNVTPLVELLKLFQLYEQETTRTKYKAGY